MWREDASGADREAAPDVLGCVLPGEAAGGEWGEAAYQVSNVREGDRAGGAGTGARDMFGPVQAARSAEQLPVDRGEARPTELAAGGAGSAEDGKVGGVAGHPSAGLSVSDAGEAGADPLAARGERAVVQGVQEAVHSRYVAEYADVRGDIRRDLQRAAK